VASPGRDHAFAAIGFSVLALATTRKGRRCPTTIATAARTADRIDYWIRRHVIQYRHEIHPSQSRLNPARDRRVGLSAIGQCLKDQYDALAAPIPPHLAGSSSNSKRRNRMDPQRFTIRQML